MQTFADCQELFFNLGDNQWNGVTAADSTTPRSLGALAIPRTTEMDKLDQEAFNTGKAVLFVCLPEKSINSARLSYKDTFGSVALLDPWESFRSLFLARESRHGSKGHSQEYQAGHLQALQREVLNPG
jgi:hypothetical protein